MITQTQLDNIRWQKHNHEFNRKHPDVPQKQIKCWIDTETRSECDLKTHGTARYAEHPSTRIQLFSYAFDDGPVDVWSPEEVEPMPMDLYRAFDDPNVTFWAHNAWFDRNVIENDLKIKLPIQRYRCSMAAALSHGLPGSLDKLGDVLGIREDAKKVKDGKRLVMKFCKPKKLKDGTLKWCTPETDPEDWELYKEYCKTDTAAMREIVKKIPTWNYPNNQFELDLWYSDQITNSRGMTIDLELAQAAMEAIAREQKELAKKTNAMTDGDVSTAGQRDEMLKHILKQYGIELPNMQKGTLNKIIDDENTPQPLRELLEVRLSTCTTSSAKYKKLLNVTSADGQLRGTVQFAGASRTLRDCLAEGTLILVLTEQGSIEEKPIEFVDITDLVWDGLEWVGHEGLVYRGEKKVIVHDSVCATPEHVVYLADGISVPLEEAKTKGLKLWQGNPVLTLSTR